MACKRRKKEKRAQDLMRIRERRSQLNAAVNSSNDIRIELNPPSTEATSPAWNALPTFQAGEIVSVEIFHDVIFCHNIFSRHFFFMTKFFSIEIIFFLT